LATTKLNVALLSFRSRTAGDSTRVWAETEIYGIQLSLGPTCGMYGLTSPMRLGPKNIVQKYKDYFYTVISFFLALTFSLNSLFARLALSRIPQHSQNNLSVKK
jgi:hypothetical protein